MYLKSLYLKNIGPFKEANLSFPTELLQDKMPPTIITGENGTGKSILIDSIRAILLGFRGIERNIVANKDDFSCSLTVIDNGKEITLSANTLFEDRYIDTQRNPYDRFFTNDLTIDRSPNWIIDYWNADVNNQGFDISNLSAIDPKSALKRCLTGNTPNIDLTKFICSIDYLRTSEDEEESKTGKYVYDMIRDILDKCLVDGKYKYVERKNFSPTFSVKGHDVSIDKLSSGNLMLMNHMISLLIKAYSICVLKNIPLEKMKYIPGVLLIDEVENHLHPKWQKSTLDIIQSFFPNLQIILTTHSPFIVSSVSDSKIYVCESEIDYSIVRDCTEDYSNLPIDEVLLTPAFNVGPFSDKITSLLNKRKKAIIDKDHGKEKEIEKELYNENREYFSFLNVNNDFSE